MLLIGNFYHAKLNSVLPFALWADVSFRMIVPTNETMKADDLRLEHFGRICDFICKGLI